MFARERTPPRNVHALGFGGFGKFTVTHDISRYCMADIFSKVGNSCQTFTRYYYYHFHHNLIINGPIFVYFY